MVAILWAGPVYAAEEGSDASRMAVPRRGPWAPAAPVADRFDWIQLKSGEWLKGELSGLRDEELEFDSEELDDLVFDWKNVKQFRSPRPHVYRFEGLVIVSGPAVIQGDSVIVTIRGEPREFDRKALVSILPGGESEWNRWSAKLSIGATLRAGNTEQLEISTLAWVKRETVRTRFRLDYNGDFSQIDGIQNTNTHRGSANLDVYLTRNLFVTAATFEVFSDRFTNIELRLTPGAGVGYHLLRGKIDWVVEIGAGYQYTEFVSVFEENPSTTNSGAFVPSTRFDIDITKRLDFQTDYTLQITVPDIGQTNHHLLSVLSFELTKYLDLDLTFNWDRIEDPTQREDGSVPKKNDYRLVVALGVEF